MSAQNLHTQAAECVCEAALSAPHTGDTGLVGQRCREVLAMLCSSQVGMLGSSRLVIEVLLINSGLLVHAVAVPQERAPEIVPQGARLANDDPGIDELFGEVRRVCLPAWEGDIMVDKGYVWEQLLLVLVRELEGARPQDDVVLELLECLTQVTAAGQPDHVLGICPDDQLIMGRLSASRRLPC